MRERLFPLGEALPGHEGRERGRMLAMARSDSFVDTLATVPLFSACSKKELQMVAKSADRVTLPAGHEVVREGAAGTEFFVILDGRARVERHGREVAVIGPGGFFGDLALLDRAPRNASVIADTDLEVAKLGQRAFDTLLDHPGFSKKLLAGLARRLREQDAKNL
jgi:CRP-like cAMP-binding protein